MNKESVSSTKFSSRMSFGKAQSKAVIPSRKLDIKKTFKPSGMSNYMASKCMKNSDVKLNENATGKSACKARQAGSSFCHQISKESSNFNQAIEKSKVKNDLINRRLSKDQLDYKIYTPKHLNNLAKKGGNTPKHIRYFGNANSIETERGLKWNMKAQCVVKLNLSNEESNKTIPSCVNSQTTRHSLPLGKDIMNNSPDCSPYIHESSAKEITYSCVLTSSKQNFSRK